ncbi:MAG: hypothetical protein ACI4XE_06195 [Acutalibacteraceae bacterium]
MSSYRPKSLDELNSRYDQAMSADIAIKKGVSGIKESENQQKGNRAAVSPEAFDMEAEGFSRKVASPKNVEDISGAVDDFIRHLNREYAPEAPAERMKPERTPLSSQPMVKKPTAVEPEPINDERSELLDNYMKVMTDQYEDDEEFSARPSGGHLKKKNRKRRREKADETVTQQPPVIPDRSEPLPLPEVDYNHADYLMKNAEPLPEETQNGTDADMSFENLHSAFNQLDEQAAEKTKPKKNKSRIVLRTLCSLLLAVVIAATAAVASLVLVLKVNTGSVAFDKYYFVTTSAAFQDANLNAGDLVVCEAESAIEDERFVLCVDRNAGSFFFGKKNGELVDDAGNKLYMVDGQSIYKDNILGTVKRSFGRIGTVIDFIFRYYIPALGILLILAIGLILLVAVVLRNKDKYIGDTEEEAYADAEEDDNSAKPESDESEEPQLEAESEPPADTNDGEEEPEPEKKSRKKKRRKEKKQRRQAEPEETSESDESEEEESDNDNADFDSYSDI